MNRNILYTHTQMGAFPLPSSLSHDLLLMSSHACAGTPALTSRQMKEAEMKATAEFLNEGVELAAAIKASLVSPEGKAPTFKVFKQFVSNDNAAVAKISELRGRVEAYAREYPMPGFDKH